MDLGISRLHIATAKIHEESAKARLHIRMLTELLAAPAPDTFLGRKTQETFPREPDSKLTGTSSRRRASP
jgi:hypothetical protein